MNNGAAKWELQEPIIYCRLLNSAINCRIPRLQPAPCHGRLGEVLKNQIGPRKHKIWQEPEIGT